MTWSVGLIYGQRPGVLVWAPAELQRFPLDQGCSWLGQPEALKRLLSLGALGCPPADR